LSLTDYPGIFRERKDYFCTPLVGTCIGTKVAVEKDQVILFPWRIDILYWV